MRPFVTTRLLVPVLCVASCFLGMLQLAAAADLETFDTRRFTDPAAAEAAREAVRLDVRTRLKTANRRHSAAWYTVQSRADWESLRDVRLAHLRRSLTLDPLPTEPRALHTTGRIDGDGYRIENVTFESRPGVWVTANVYSPRPAREKMPGILIIHSHHAPKTQGELQGMGMTFARSGAVVLVMDQLGHGERRTHTFAAEQQYPGEYRASRQDYYFRYNTGVQLSLVGESLRGWMVGDIMTGATLVARRPGVDPSKLILLGAVAGGGDPAGVAGALDRRFAAVVPFNYGGYEPEDSFPLPDDAETTFNYAGGGSWESTRNLRLSARDGFMPWAVIGSIAPRGLIYAHEFRWDEPRDPVWKRLNTIFGLYEAGDKLGSAFGSGTVRGKTVADTHCTNIGALHRKQLYPLLEQWCGLTPPTEEYPERRTSDELRCRPADAAPFALHEVLQKIAAERLAAARARRAELDVAELRAALRRELGGLLGTVDSPGWEEDAARSAPQTVGPYVVEVVAPTSREATGPIPLPMTIIRAAGSESRASPPLVVAVAQGGKAALLKQKAELIRACIEQGGVFVAVDLRGTGETRPTDEGRGRTAGSTSRSSTEQMLGETILGQRLRDLLTTLAYLRARDEFSRSQIALYGDGLVAANSAERSPAAPLDAADLPTSSEPLGSTVCLLAALWDDSIAAVYGGGGLVSAATILEGPYFYVPHDAVLPGSLAQADLADLLAAQKARIKLADLRDGANRAASAMQRERLLADYQAIATGAGRGRVEIAESAPTAKALAAWLLTSPSGE